MPRYGGRYRLALWTAFPILLITLSMTLGVMFANSGYVRASLQGLISRLLPGDTVRFRLLQIDADLSVTLHDVVVSHPTKRPDGTYQELVKAKEVRARLATDLTMISGGQLELTDIYLSDVDAFLEFDDTGHLSLLDAFVPKGPPEPDSGAPFYLSLSNARIVRSEVRMAFPEFGIEARGIDVPQFNLVLEDGVLSMNGEVAIDGGRLQTVSADPEIAPIVVEVQGATVEGFDWKGDGFKFAKAEVRLPGGRLSAEGHLALTELLPFKLIGKFTGDVDLPVAAQFIGELLKGPVQAHFQLEGPLMEPYGTYRIESKDLSLATPGFNEEGRLHLRDLAVLGSLEKWRLKLQEVRFGALGGKLTTAGLLDLRDPANIAYEATIEAKDIDTALFLGGAPAATPWVAGRLDTSLAISGAGITPEGLAADVAVRSLELRRKGGVTPVRVPAKVRVTADARIEGQRVRVKGLSLDAGPHRLVAKGSVDAVAQTLDLDVQVTTGPLAELLAPVLPQDIHLAAHAALSGRVRGPLVNPTVDGTLELSKVDVLDVLTDVGFSGNLALQGGRVTWTGINSPTQLGRLQFDAAVRLWEEGGDITQILVDPPIEVTRGRVSGLKITQFLPADLPFDGRLEGSFEVSGLASDPRVEAWVTSGGVTLYGERIEKIQVEAAYQAGEVDVPALEVLLDQDRKIQGAGRMSLQGEFNGHLRGERLPLHAIRHVADAVPDAAGDLSFNLTAEGDLQSPRVQGMIQLTELHLAGRRLGNAYLSVGNRSDGALFVRSDNVFDHIRLDARVPLDGTPPHADFRFDKLPVERFAPELTEAGMTARFSGAGRFQFDEDGDPGVGVSLQDVAVTIGDQRLGNRAPDGSTWPWQLGFEDGLVQLRSITLIHGATRLSVEEGWFNPEDQTLFVTARGVTDAGLARLVGDEVARAEGSLEVSVTVSGTATTPEISGEIGVATPIELTLRALPGRRILLNSGAIKLNPGQVLIPRDQPLRGALDDGYFTVSGTVALDELKPTDADLKVDAQQIEWREPKFGLRLVANADLTLEAQRLLQRSRQMVLSGLIDLVEGEVKTRDDRLDLRSWVDARQEVQTTVADADSPLAALQFRELKIVGRDSFKVDAKVNNLGFLLEVQPQLNLEGTALRPLLQGTVQAAETDSRITYSGHEFEVSRGTVEFDQDGNPILDIEAEAEIEPKFVPSDEEPKPPPDGMEIHRVKIIVKGLIDVKNRRYDQLVIRFEDDRGLDEADTLLLVLTGILPDDLRLKGGGGGAAVDTVLAPFLREVEALAKGGTGNVIQKLELASRVDSGEVSLRIGTKAFDNKLALEAATDLRYNDSTSQTEAQTAIEARFKVTDEFWLDLRTDTSQLETQGAVRYRLTIPQD